MELTTAILLVAGAVGLYMAWNIGANDVANAMGTSVGSGALTLKRAIIVAAIFEFSGAMLVGGNVTNTIRKGIIDISAVGGDGMIMAIGMTACLLAAALWLNLATYLGWPVSTTHSIVGAVLGFGVVAAGFDAVSWGVMAKVAASWVVSPLIGGALGFVVFMSLQKRILRAERPLMALRRWTPVFIFPVLFVLALSVVFKGLKPLRLDLSIEEALLAATATGLVAALISIPLVRRFTAEEPESNHDQLVKSERLFMVLQIMTACFVAFAHGSNDVANAVGPLAAVVGALRDGVQESVRVPMWVMVLGGGGIVVGLATYGYKIMATVGEKITELTPSRGFAAEFGAATTIVAASKLGLPVSTTHTLVGAVIGVGFARGISAINLQVLKGILASWFITVPLTAVLAGLLFLAGKFALL